MRKIKFASVQFALRPFKDFTDFSDSVIRMLDQARDADVVVFGEWFTLGLLASEVNLKNATYDDIRKVAKYTDQLIELFKGLAKERRQILVAGTTVEYDNNYYDTSYILTPDNIFKHRKTHLFPLEVEWGLSEYDTLDIMDLGRFKAGICICYESQIPECARTLTMKGAEVIFCPSFTITEAGYNRIRHCCEARCIENQVITILSSTVNSISLVEGKGRSAILSPCDKPWPSNGLIAEGKNDVEMVISSEIDLDNIYVTREKGAARTHKDRIRRAALYKEWLYQ